MIIFCSICASDMYLCSHLAILSFKLLPVLFKKKEKEKNIEKNPYPSGPSLKQSQKLWSVPSAGWSSRTRVCMSRIASLNVNLCPQRHKISSLFLLLLTFAVCIIFLQDHGQLIQRCLLVAEGPRLAYWWSPETSNQMQDGLFLYGSHEVLQQAALSAERRGI